jgi:hypothetical protein
MKPALPRILCVLTRINRSNVIDRRMFTTKIIIYGNSIEAHIALTFLTIRQKLEWYGVLLCASESATRTDTAAVMLRVLNCL